MRTRESMKNRKHNGQNKKLHKDNNDPQNTTQKIKHSTKIKSQTPNQDQELLSGSEALQVFYYLFMSILLMKSPLSPRGAPLTGLRPHPFCAGHKPATSWVVVFCFMFYVFRWDVVISFCWYWWSCWQSLFKLSLQNFDTQESTMTMFLTCLHTFQHLNTIH